MRISRAYDRRRERLYKDYDDVKDDEFSWSSYWATLISVTVEADAPSDVVLTFPIAKDSLDSSDFFTIEGRTITNVSWAGTILTLTVSPKFVYGDEALIIFELTGGTANVTNNISAEAELTTYISGLITPLSVVQRQRLNTLIKTLKSGLEITDLDDAFDVMYILAGETSESALRNLVKNAHHSTAVNNPTFTQYEGYVGGATKYINTSYAPNTHGVNYVLNSASLGVYLRTTTIGTYTAIGTSDSVNESYINPRMNYDTIGRFYCRVNQATYTFKTSTGDTKGMSVVSRIGANAIDGYKNGTDFNCTGNTEVSTSLQNYNIYLLAINSAGTGANYSPDQLSIAFAGRGFDNEEINIITNAIEEYMNSIGKSVVD